MPPTPEAAGALARALAALPVVVEDVRWTATPRSVPSYPGGRRPHSVVTLAGAGASGAGEHVGWSDADHARFGAAAPTLAPRGRRPLGGWAADLAWRAPEPYDRAALEAAAIDLALRQAGTNLFALAALAPAPVRYVVSFDRRPDPAAAARELRAAVPAVELKVDVDPAWDEAAWRALAATGAVAVLDWKGGGAPAEHERAHRLFRHALLEDPGPGDVPWSAGVRSRLAADATVLRAVDVAALPVAPVAVNVKPARMGGVLEALACVAACAARGIVVYVGGMFEVGPGRAQLQALAALLCPEGPNDVAPIGVGTAPPPRPPRLRVDPDAPGFGAPLLP